MKQRCECGRHDLSPGYERLLRSGDCSSADRLSLVEHGVYWRSRAEAAEEERDALRKAFRELGDSLADQGMWLGLRILPFTSG